MARTDFGSMAPPEPATFAEEIAALDRRLTRWRALQKAVRCVPLIPPVDYFHVTSNFGKRKDPFSGQWAMHEGIDLGAWPGSAIMAAAPGKVVRAGHSSGYGRMVEIDHGCGIRTIYGHMKKILVKKGEQVDHRQRIGTVGSTGRSTGPHVHYEIRVDGEPRDPSGFIKAGRHVFKI